MFQGNGLQSITYHGDYLYIINTEKTSVMRILGTDIENQHMHPTALETFGPLFYSLSDVKVFGERNVGL